MCENKKKSLKGSISCIFHARLFIATYLFYPWWLSIKHILKQITINNLSKIRLKSMWFILSCYMVFILLPWTKNYVWYEILKKCRSKAMTGDATMMRDQDTNLYTRARIFNMVATSGWSWPLVFSRSSKACLQSGTATS